MFESPQRELFIPLYVPRNSFAVTSAYRVFHSKKSIAANHPVLTGNILQIGPCSRYPRQMRLYSGNLNAIILVIAHQ